MPGALPGVELVITAAAPGFPEWHIGPRGLCSGCGEALVGQGRMSKERNKKLIRITVTIWVVITVLILIFLTFFLPNLLVYGSLTPTP